jgi:hypothetical protein
MRERERERVREKERKVVSFVAYFSFQWEIRKLLVALPLLLWSDCGPKKSTGIQNQHKDVYLRACPMLEDVPVMRAYPVLLAALPPPVREGGEAEDNNFDHRCRCRRPSSSPMATGARQGRTAWTRPAPPPLHVDASATRRYPCLCFCCCHPPSLPWPSLWHCCC